MQTFLPYGDFIKSAKSLDFRRLNKQRIEAYQIWCTLQNPTAKGWKNHPAVKMWRGYEEALLLYHDAMIREWISRGYKNTMPLRATTNNVRFPKWFGSREFHLSHRSNLIRKYPEYYIPQFGEIPNDLPYVWPV